MDQPKPSKSEQIALIPEWASAGECVQLSLVGDDETRRGFPLAVSHTFVAILSTREWHADGVEIVPIAKIDEISIDPESRKILEWNGVRTTNRYFWLDLDGYSPLFQSIRKKGLFITVEDEGGLDVGLVATIGPNFVRLATIDTAGDWDADLTEYAYENITIIHVDGEYANVLGEYNRQTVANR
jgi:hypothetical protein